MNSAQEIHATATERGLSVRTIDFSFDPDRHTADMFIQRLPANRLGPVLHVQFSSGGRVMAAYIARGDKANRSRMAISGPAWNGPRAGKRAVLKVLDLLAKGLL